MLAYEALCTICMSVLYNTLPVTLYFNNALALLGAELLDTGELLPCSTPPSSSRVPEASMRCFPT
jgi:hypothetical protein